MLLERINAAEKIKEAVFLGFNSTEAQTFYIKRLSLAEKISELFKAPLEYLDESFWNQSCKEEQQTTQMNREGDLVYSKVVRPLKSFDHKFHAQFESPNFESSNLIQKVVTYQVG